MNYNTTRDISRVLVWGWHVVLLLRSSCPLQTGQNSLLPSCAKLLQSCPTLQRYGLYHQVPLSMKFSRQEYWSGLPFPPPRVLSDLGIKPRTPALASIFFTTKPLREHLSSITGGSVLYWVQRKQDAPPVTEYVLQFSSWRHRRKQNFENWSCCSFSCSFLEFQDMNAQQDTILPSFKPLWHLNVLQYYQYLTQLHIIISVLV